MYIVFDQLENCLGVGAVYGYDAVGSFKRDDYGAMGSGQNFVIPFLDNLVILEKCKFQHIVSSAIVL